MKRPHDDYYWPEYTDIYSNQTRDMQQDTYDFVIQNSYVDGDKIVFKDHFHENWKDLYSKILELKATSVMECGCGPGHHLYNIKHLFPSIEIFGVDLLETQCDHGHVDLKIPKEFYDNITIGDFTIPNIYQSIGRQFDFVFTQAVTQHLNHEKAVTFIQNMAGVSGKYIMMKENLNNHDYEFVFKETGILNEFDLEIIPGELMPSIFLKRKGV